MRALGTLAAALLRRAGHPLQRLRARQVDVRRGKLLSQQPKHQQRFDSQRTGAAIRQHGRVEHSARPRRHFPRLQPNAPPTRPASVPPRTIGAMRSLLRLDRWCSWFTAATVAAVAWTPPPTRAADFTLRLIGQAEIATGKKFGGIEIGGLSGLTRLRDGRFIALSDDRGDERRPPRFYTLALDYDGSGVRGVNVLSQTLLRQPDGSAFATQRGTVDPEALRVLPNGDLLWSSEGIWSADPARRQQPFVRQMRLDGGFVRQWPVPVIYELVDNATRGGRDNLLFEALAVAPGGAVFVANEAALWQDGDVATLQAGSPVRVTRLDPAGGAPLGQTVYEVPPIPLGAAPGFGGRADNGLADLLALSEQQFIALERAYAPGVGNTVRLALATITPETTDVRGIDALKGAAYMPMRRELLLEMSINWQGVKIDNLEGITLGHTLANGHCTLVLVSDNNFNPRQRTQFVVLEMLPVGDEGVGGRPAAAGCAFQAQ